MLRDYDWINEPLIINFNQELTSKEEILRFPSQWLRFLEDQIFEMQKQFKSDRASFPPLCLMPSVVFYETNKPMVPILKRVIQLAKQALIYLEKNPSDSMKVCQ